MTDTPLLSLLIPTKNRYGTLIPVVETVARCIDDPRLEIVIQDNSSVETPARLNALLASDRRFSYAHRGDPVSIVDNAEEAIGRARGEYLCFIGDDDLVSPHIMKIGEWLSRQDADCLIYPPGRYWWPGVEFARESVSQRPGVFWLPEDRKGGVRGLDPRRELQTVLSRGGIAYMELPRLYHGLASKRALERVRSQFGRFVPGSSPDMALCIALAMTGASCLFLSYPASIFGASRNSGAGQTAAGRHYGRIEDQQHMPRGMAENWDPALPRIFSEQIIYPQTIYEIMTSAGRPERVSYPALYASLLAYEPHIVKHLWPVLRRYVLDHPRKLPELIGQTALKLAGRARRAFRLETGNAMPFEFSDFSSVDALMVFMAQLPPPVIDLDAGRAGPRATKGHA